jgi:hypothetical protein
VARPLRIEFSGALYHVTWRDDWCEAIFELVMRFVKRVQRKIGIQPAPTLTKIAAKHHARNDTIYDTYATGAYSYREIAEYYGLHLATVE